ncbi:MAG: ISL3 family transposase [Candidatus Hydrothermarchaeota archaeon]
MEEIILKIFNLQGMTFPWKNCEVSDEEILLEFGESGQAMCPHCGTLSQNRHERGKLRKIYHGYGFGRRVYLLLRKDRYFCKRCQRSFTERVPLVLPQQRKTLEAEDQILESLRGQSFKSLAEKEGISYGVARRVLQRRLDPEELIWEQESEEELSLGIDAHSFRGTQLVNTVTDIRSHRPLTILPDNRKETVKRFLRNIPEGKKQKLMEVCIDMDHMLLAAVQEKLPEAKVVVDHFHVIHDANRRVDEARKIEQDVYKAEIPRKIFLIGKERLSRKQQQKVESYCQKYPSLKEFYWMKEALRSFYRLKRKKTAEKRLKDLIEIALLSDDAAMVQWGRTLKRWSPYILNYFDNRTTNAYTEGIHTKIKMVKRISFGFRNVEVYVRKVLLSLLPLTVILNLPHLSL